MVREKRSDSRFQARPDSTELSIQVIQGRDEIPATLMDMSRGGVRISLAKELSVGDPIRLQLHLADGRLIDANVCWVASDILKGWIVGCSFLNRISSEEMAEIAASKMLERRTNPRQEVSCYVAAKTTTNSTYQQVQIVNLSNGGFSAKTSSLHVRPDDRLLLLTDLKSFKHAKHIRARVEWVREDKQVAETTIGCSFLTTRDGRQLKSVVDAGSMRRPIPPTTMTEINGKTHWGAVAVSLLLLIQISQYIWR